MHRLLSRNELQHLLIGTGVELPESRVAPNVAAIGLIILQLLVIVSLFGMLLKAC